jgi:hypothetical protein
MEELTFIKVFSRAFGSSVSIRLRSCEKRLVTTPVSVDTKKDKGACISVRKISQWRLAPDFLTETMNRATATRNSDTRAQNCSKA